MTEPHIRAWADQFGALLRDKCRQMIVAVDMTGWASCAHAFYDPGGDGEKWQIIYDHGDFYAQNLDEDDPPVLLDLDALGVFRH